MMVKRRRKSTKGSSNVPITDKTHITRGSQLEEEHEKIFIKESVETVVKEFEYGEIPVRPGHHDNLMRFKCYPPCRYFGKIYNGRCPACRRQLQ